MNDTMIPIVTVSDENYLPGLVALYNSFLRNSADGFEFWAMIRGSDEFIEHVKSLGINVIVEPSFPIDRFPTSKRYPNEEPLFYWRLLIPEIFKQDYSFFVDCDSLILQSLQPLVDKGTNGRPVAATASNSPRMMEYGPAGSSEERGGSFGPLSSLYLFNRAVWDERAVFERCIEAMKSDTVFHTIVQGLVQYVLGDDWHEWPWQTQAHAHHDTFATYPRKQIYTLHYMAMNPWEPVPTKFACTQTITLARQLWKEYA
jgi:lipopolysaccharide biosynthesis glycosyltransferase